MLSFILTDMKYPMVIGIYQGESTLLLGCGTNDTTGGVILDVSAGDVIVIPAGTAHCSLQSSVNYRYVGVYPKVSTFLSLFFSSREQPTKEDDGR